MKKLYSFTNSQKHHQKKSFLLRLIYQIPGGKTLLNGYVNLVHKNRLRLVEKVINSGRLLDAGCGTGEFLTLFNPQRWKLTGVEINSSLTENLKTTHPHIHIYNNSLNNFNPRKKFEVITIWHVLEHLRNPQSFVIKIHRILHSKGWLFIEVPQGDSLGRKLFGSHWNLLLAPEHLFFWTASSLSHFLIINKFEVVRIEFRGIISSFPGSLGNWIRAHGVPGIWATLVGLCLFPIAIFVNGLFPDTRDNVLIIARKK